MSVSQKKYFEDSIIFGLLIDLRIAYHCDDRNVSPKEIRLPITSRLTFDIQHFDSSSTTIFYINKFPNILCSWLSCLTQRPIREIIKAMAMITLWWFQYWAVINSIQLIY